MAKGKNVLTTGDVARICNVAPRTVSKWFDKGQLKGYRIPGSKDRRIPRSELVRFMREHNIPSASLDTGQIRILIAGENGSENSALAKVLSARGNYEVQTVQSNFETGAVVQKFLPHVLLINLMSKNINAMEIRKSICNDEELQMIKVIAIANKLSSSEASALLSKGFDGYISNSSDISEVIRKIEESTAIIY